MNFVSFNQYDGGGVSGKNTVVTVNPLSVAYVTNSYRAIGYGRPKLDNRACLIYFTNSTGQCAVHVAHSLRYVIGRLQEAINAK